MPEKCFCLIGYKNGNLEGLLVIVRTETAIIARIDGESLVVNELLTHFPKENLTLFFPENLFPIVKRNFPSADYQTFSDWQMHLQKSEERLTYPELARKLTPKDSTSLKELYALVKPNELYGIEPYQNEENCKKLIKDRNVYGIFQEGQLVASATVMKIEDLPEVALISSLFTHPQHRNKGYGSAVISAAIKETLKKSKWVTLYVRSSNETAIKLYQKIGFKKTLNWKIAKFKGS
jgi:ribosomal protein S18 acetylase RimI-like enzyme